MAHVESRRYEAAQLPTDAKYQLISAWIAGECYGVPAPALAANAATHLEQPGGAAAELEIIDADGAKRPFPAQ
jgi:hypothetical protein